MKPTDNIEINPWEYSQKAMEIFRQFRKESPNTNGSIRSYIIEGMDYLEVALQLVTDNKDNDNFVSFNVMNLAGLLGNASKLEFKYAVERLTKWFELGYENCNNGLAQILTVELSKEIKERRIDLSERELVGIIMRCKATMGYPLSRLLNIPAVREVYIKKASGGERRYAFALGTYYYKSEEYGSAFKTLKNIQDAHAAKYIGLMYYYGRGTEQNPVLAKEYLERYYETTCGVEPEVIWALGNLYGSLVSIQKQFDLYIRELENPYVNYDDSFIKRMLKQCVIFKRHTMIKDSLFMIIEVGPEDLECEFSLEMVPYCHLNVNWDDKTCGIYGDLETNGTVTCRHKYLSPGTYTITIESLWEKVIEGFEFIRHKRQLHTIYLGDCAGLKRLSIVGQCLTNLDITPGSYRKWFLTGIICRDNLLTKLDLRHCPNITHLDCSYNPIHDIKLPRHTTLNKICIKATNFDKIKFDDLLRLNRGGYCNPLTYEDLVTIDLPLEQFFRRTNWDKVRKYIRLNVQDYYDHKLAECELAFAKLKELSKEVNHNPYEDKGGFLAVHSSYVSDDSILHHEEFFTAEEEWTTSLATKVRDVRRREPWMGHRPTAPEYFVASCLVNMIQNRCEMENMQKRHNCSR